MIPGPVLRRVLLSIAIVLILALAWTGIDGGVTQFSGARTTGQMTQTVLQLVNGVLALLSIVTAFWAQRWNRLLLVCWTATLAVMAGLASVAWGGTSALIGIVSGVAAGLIGAGIAWLLRFGADRSLVP